jgi:VRR-NUC domain
MALQKESHIQKQILDYLKLKRCVVFKHRNVGIRKPNGSYIPLAFGEKGISDIIGCLPDGRFLAIEVKQPKGKVSPEQEQFIANVLRNNGVAFVARSLDEVIKQIA